MCHELAKRILPCRRRVLLCYISLLFPLLCATTSSVDAQSKKQDESEWTVLRAPEEIPDYLAWRYFFWSVDRNYRLGAGFYYGFINLRLKLGPLFEGDRNVGERIVQILADRATLAYREEERFRSESQYRRRFMDMGALTAEEFDSKDRAAFVRRVKAMERACNELHREILEVAPQTGRGIWDRVYDYVQSEVKSSTSVMVGEGDDSLEATLGFRCPR